MTRHVIATILAAFTCAAAEKWIRVTSPNFELYTPQSEKRGRETILYFEQVREFFEKAVNAKQSSRVPVRIVVFASEQQYKPYRFSEFAAAFYQPGVDRDYIVMGGYLQDSERVAIHEYVHLMVRHAGLNLPVWLNEGEAELYSTLRPIGGKVVIGGLIPAHLMALQSSSMPLSQLLAVGHRSAEYNRKSHVGLFYAESWALTHMLQLTKEYRPGFDQFLKSVLAGTDSKEALEKTYQRPLAEIEKDLKAYVRTNDRFSGAIVPVKFEKADVTPVVSAIDATAAKAVCTSILVAGGRLEDAKAALSELEASADRPEIAETLAYAAWRGQDLMKARALFEKALTNQPVASPQAPA